MSFDAYYYSFEPTGNTAIDAVLEAVADAGSGCHHTEDWRTEYNGRPSFEAQIQAVAEKAAADLRAALQAQQGDAVVLAAADRVRKADSACRAQKGLPAMAEAHEYQAACRALVDAAMLAARREG